MKTIAILFLLLFVGTAHAVTITGASGTISTGSTITVSGSSLPTKTRSKLYSYSDAQEGATNPHSTLSFLTTFNEKQNITFVNDGNKRWGNGCFRSNWNYTSTQRAATVRSDMPIGYGGRGYISIWERSDINYTTTDSDTVNGVVHIPGRTQNWKYFVRGWSEENEAGERYPDIIYGHVGYNETANNIRVGNEKPDNSNTIGSGWGFPTTTWRRSTVLFQMPSALNVADGQWYMYQGTTLIDSSVNQHMNDVAHPNLPEEWYVQHVIANKNVPSGKNWWFGDVIFDEGWGRYEICNSANYSTATECNIQPFTSVSATNASLTIRLGAMTGSLYLFAFDNNNNRSNAWPLSSGVASPPFIFTLSPSNGPAVGGTTVTVTGASLVATPSVTVNGIAATNEILNSSTEMTFITPAGVADTTVDVVLANPDLQNATCEGCFTYDAEPITVTQPAGVLPWMIEESGG